MTTPAIRNEQRKLFATAVNNIGVASIATGCIGPTVGFFVGSIDTEDPLRLLSFVVICLVVGGSLLMGARHILEGLEA